MSAENGEQKPIIPTKSSMEILSELFSTFHAEPPLIIKEEKSEETIKKRKKSKKKHKHKNKKHKKEKKKKRTSSSSSGESEVDLAKILIKQEKDTSKKKIKIEGTNLAWDLKLEKLKKEKYVVNPVDTASTIKNNNDKICSNGSGGKHKIIIKDLKSSSIFESSIKGINDKVKEMKDEDGEIDSNSSISDREKKRKKKRKHKSDLKKRSRSTSEDKNEDKTEKKFKVEDLRYKIKIEHKHQLRSSDRDQNREKGRHRSRSRDKNDDFYKGTDRSRNKDEHRSCERERNKDRHRENRSKERYKDEYTRELEDYKRNRGQDNSFYKDDGFYKFRDRERENRDGKWFMRDR